jgi:coenzyme F420-0:L-glutamate ligase/coenzyme F420-1:gamma-L-glutamate ligase
MNNFQCIQNAIRQRRSIRRYTSQPVTKDIIDRLLSAAIWAPSAHNRQPWRFAVLVQSETKDRLATTMGKRLRADRTADGDDPADIEQDVARSYARLTGAPVLIVLSASMEDMDSYPDTTRAHYEWVMATQSTAMAGQNILLMAHALGLGACWVCAPLFVPELVKQALNLPEDWTPQGLITVGYPAQGRQKSRAPLNEKVLYL